MTEKLREALHETAELGQTANVPDTLWADAQRARRRDRVVLPLVALILIACAGAVLGVLTQPHHEAAPADGSDLAVPSHIYGMTDSSGDYNWGYQGLPPEADGFDLGSAAALVEVQNGGWAVVSAKDGSYHRLKGPSSWSFDDTRPVLARQGDRIAWGRDTRARSTLQISVADLMTGEVTRFPIKNARVPAGTRDLTWSANGRYLAFRTSETRHPGSDTRSLFRLYVLDTRTGDVSSRDTWGDTIVPIAATDAGGVAITWDGALRIWQPGRGVEVATSSSGGASSMAISPDGSVLAMSVSRNRVEGTDAPAVVAFLPAGPGSTAQLELSADADVTVLGWTRDGQAVALVGDPYTSSGTELVLIDVGASKSRVVGTIDTYGVEGVQIATALMTSDHPTVDRDEPSWVDHDFPWWRAFGISLILGLFLLAVVNVRRRRMAG